MTVPHNASFGPTEITLTQDGVSRRLTIFATGDKTDFPIFTGGADQICQGLRFYDGSGVLQTGTKDCAVQKSAESLAPCKVDGEIDCRANVDFKAVDMTRVLPDKIHSGHTLAGVTGQYPSAAYRLTGSDETLDLPSFGLTSAGGTYEWFQSDGTRVTGSIEAHVNVVPSSTTQVLNTGLYRAVTVMGEPSLVASNIRSSTTIFGVTGTYPSNTTPLASDTNTPDLTSFGSGTPVGIYEFFDRAGTVYSATVADYGPITPSTSSQTISNASTLYRQVSVSGDTNLAAAKITSGTTIFGVAGNVTLPDANKVLTGTSYGVGGTGLSGNLTLPGASNVLTGSGTYGDPTSALTPTLTLPAVGKVLSGITYGVGGTGSMGTLILPAANYVQAGSLSYGDPGSPIAPSLNMSAIMIRPVAPPISGVSFNFSPDRVTLTWGAVTDASGYIVLMNKTQAVSWTPTDFTTYSTGTYGSDILIYAGSGTSVTYNTPVTAGTTFYFAVYSYQSNQVYSYTPSTKTMFSCAGLLGGTWVPVPGDSIYGTNGFCVQKYVPSYVSGVATSQAGSEPWKSLSQPGAINACANLGSGYHLITNPEWMTIAANIANTGSNWSGGSVGSGTLSRGHSDSNPAQDCAPNADDIKAWVETDCLGQTQGTLEFSQRRTQFLSNNYVIWDFNGNTLQWVDYNNPSDMPTGGEYPSVVGSTTTPKSHLVPLAATQPWWYDGWNSSRGIGLFFAGTNDGTSGGMLRGGYWMSFNAAGPFYARMSLSPLVTIGTISFRCTWQP